MSGAEPWTGSNNDGKLRSGFKFADGAKPIVPVQAGPKSDKISPNKLEATTTSKRSGDITKRAHKMSICCLSVVMSGYCSPIKAARSSQYGMLIAMPLDFVAMVTCLRARWRASSNAYFKTRSVPIRLNTAS